MESVLSSDREWDGCERNREDDVKGIRGWIG